MVDSVCSGNAEVGKGESSFDPASVNRSQMARAMGVNVAHVSRVLNGKTHPSLVMARRMAEYLKVPLEEFCNVILARRSP